MAECFECKAEIMGALELIEATGSPADEPYPFFVGKWKDPSSYTEDWNAVNLSSGMYLYRLQAGDFVKTKTILLLK